MNHVNIVNNKNPPLLTTRTMATKLPTSWTSPTRLTLMRQSPMNLMASSTWTRTTTMLSKLFHNQAFCLPWNPQRSPLKHNVFSSEPKLCGPTSFSATTEELPKIVKKVHFDDAHQPASLEAASNNVEEPSNKDEKDSLDIHYKESDFPIYTEDMLPDGADHVKLKKRYKAIKEEFYTQSGHRPVTPSNFRSWMNKSKGRNKRWHFWEIFSGSGRLSLTLLLSGLSSWTSNRHEVWLGRQQHFSSSHASGSPTRVQAWHYPLRTRLCTLECVIKFQGSSTTTSRSSS